MNVKFRNTLVHRILLFVLIGLQACSVFTPPKEKPIIEDRLGRIQQDRQFGTLAITPERKLVVFRFQEEKFCAEPPADVAENLSSSVKLLAQISKGDVGGTGEFGKALGTSIKQLFIRSQGVQLYRDASFTLCQAHLNHVIDNAQYIERYDKLLDITKELIMKELPYLEKYKPDSPDLPNADLPPSKNSRKEDNEKGAPPTPKPNSSTKTPDDQ
jgi:hypothetical protein